MKRVQAVALDLFEASGFAAVTIDEIATAAEVSAPTIYRHFGTKERIVLWDDYDPVLFAAVGRASAGRTLLAKLTAALVRAVKSLSHEDESRILRRTRLINAEPSLRVANTATLAALRDGLAQVLTRSGATKDELAADVVAGAVAFALEAAVRKWECAAGAIELSVCVRDALNRLRVLNAESARPPQVAVP